MGPTHSGGARGRVAIVGVGAIFPGSPDLGRFWANIEGGTAGAREVPPGRWPVDPLDAFDPAVGRADHVYSTRGCFVEGFELDPEGLDLDPGLLGRLDPMFLLALHAGRAAWRDARTVGLDRSRVGVVFGNLVLPTEAASAIARDTLGRTFEERLGLEPVDPPGASEPLNTRVAGLPAGLLARALGLGGGACTVDAACASSLYALKLAADELIEGRADAMLAGGLSRPDPLYTQMGFSQLRALSPTGVASPFGAAADGLVVGEGAGLFVLKRLADAVDQGDTIYGVIAGIGLSNDLDGGLLAPHSEGQLRAMRAAYDRAGWSPGDVDLIECHATGTPVGDAVEFASLRALWAGLDGEPGRCAIGSVKSNLGHCLTAAGAAGLLKVLLALRHETLPPTAGFDRPAPGLDVDRSPFRILSQSEPWPRRAGATPRRAALSGFGFGGINAHALIEEWIPGPVEAEVAAPAPDAPEPIAIVGLAAHFGPFGGLRAFGERVLGGSIAGAPSGPRRWWGVESSGWFAREGPAAIPTAYRVDAVGLPTDRFRIPPKELEEMLPQQSLLLRLAGEAVDDSGWDDRARPSWGCLVGLGLDLNATNFHVRWMLPDRAREWSDRLELGLSPEAVGEWAEDLRGAFGPALSANRTMGALGSIAASRVAREFRLGGPSFTVSAEETSGFRALEIAVGMLRRGDLDGAIVGAVDLPGDPRASIAEAILHPSTVLGEGAAVVVLKRLADAVRDGDKVYAVVRGVGLATGDDREAVAASAARAFEASGVDPAGIGYYDPGLAGGIAPPFDPRGCALASAGLDVGHAGAASGLASVVKATLALHHQMLPMLRDGGARPHGDFVMPKGPQAWLRDRVDGPRRALVGGPGIDGNAAHVVLESFEPGASDDSPDRRQAIGPRPAALFAVEADDAPGLLRGLDALEDLAASTADGPIERPARDWWRDHPGDTSRGLAVAIVAESRPELLASVAEARRRVGAGEGPVARPGDRVAFSPRPIGPESGLAFVFPGMGNHFPGMGRELSAHWPEVLRSHDARNDRLRSQMAGGTYWNVDPPTTFDDHRQAIFGQVAFGTFASDLLRSAGLEPVAAIGHSLGETTALFALGAWSDRDEMFRRFDDSTLFRSDLAGPCHAARVAWGLGVDEPVDWVAGILQAPVDRIRAAAEGIDRADLLIVNTDRQAVVGGQGPAVRRLVEAVGGRFHPLPLVSTVHSEVVRPVASAYHDLHLLPTSSPPGVRFFSGSTGEPYAVDRESAAGSILSHALHGVDFPAVVRRAYDEGIRAFVEVGPGGSCTRMIGEILGGRPHLAVAACPDGREPVVSVLVALARLIAERYPVDLASLYDGGPAAEVASKRTIRVEVGGRPFAVDARSIPAPKDSPADPITPESPTHPEPAFEVISSGRQDAWEPSPVPDFFASSVVPPSAVADPLVRQVAATQSARGGAHEAFLRASGNLGEALARHLAFQMDLLGRLSAGPAIVEGRPEPVQARPPAPAFDRDACLAFAVGRIGDVLGPDFGEVDAFPTRVRLPDEPLMLVDRILSVEGEPRSMATGRVVTEHDVLAGSWYLDAGRIPTCIAVEAGQADLFLSSYLGVDFETRGLAVYRLLDAVVTFHGELPGAGRVIRYDIAIDGFFRQGDSRLFRFRFEATVDGEPLMTMSQGCAGFFTAEALAAGRGIVRTGLDLRPTPGIRPDDWAPLVPMMAAESLDDRQVEALRLGDLVGAFGPASRGWGSAVRPGSRAA